MAESLGKSLMGMVEVFNVGFGYHLMLLSNAT